MRAALKDKIKKIKLLILDVDGVMTGGDIILDAQGKETKIFNVYDGYGIVLFQRAGYKVALLSARLTEAVNARARDLNINFICQDAYPKINAYQKLIGELGLKDEQVCFMGDDLPDAEVLQKVGFSVSVPNAVNEVKQIVDHITKCKGGQGAIREVIEIILRTQGKWTDILKACKA